MAVRITLSFQTWGQELLAPRLGDGYIKVKNNFSTRKPRLCFTVWIYYTIICRNFPTEDIRGREDFEMGSLSWVIKMGLKSNHNCPYKTEAEEISFSLSLSLSHTHTHTHIYIQRRRRCCEGAQRDWKMLTLKADLEVMQTQGKECWQPTEAGRGKEEFYSRASRGSSALSTLDSAQ